MTDRRKNFSSKSWSSLFVVVFLFFQDITISQHEEVVTVAGSRKGIEFHGNKSSRAHDMYSRLTPPLHSLILFLSRMRKGGRKKKVKSIANTERTTDSCALPTKFFFDLLHARCVDAAARSRNAETHTGNTKKKEERPGRQYLTAGN